MSGGEGYRECQCGEPQRWAAKSNSPIQFDARLNEYHLVCGDAYGLLRYCFFCGGRLPDSKREALFSIPNDAEQEEVRRLIGTAKNLQDVLAMLGKPDETFDEETCREYAVANELRWKRLYRYSSRWKTLVLDVLEQPEGGISYVVSGRYIGGPDGG